MFHVRSMTPILPSADLSAQPVHVANKILDKANNCGLYVVKLDASQCVTNN